MAAVLEQTSERGEAFIVNVPSAPSDVSTGAVLACIIWSGCLLVGVLGFVLPYTRPLPPLKEEPPVKAEVLQVELTTDPLPPLVPKSSASLPKPPALDQAPTVIPDIPPMTPVAEPDAVAFAMPVEGPVMIVEPAKASFAAAPPTEPKPSFTAPPVQTLTYGQGEGRQPAPEYPYRARREGQQGVVGIRFSVGENGRVLSAEAISPCPWKLLNDSALRVVRDRWRFPSGAVRLYEVSIRFQLTR